MTPAYTPVFKGPIEGYVVNHLRANYWRVSALLEYEDVLQEAWVVFLSLVRRYSEIDTPQHFMSLFKTSWRNHFNDLATATTRSRSIPVYQYEDGEDQDFIGQIVGDLNTMGVLPVLVNEAPPLVRTVISFLVSDNCGDASSFIETRSEKRSNALLCRLLGFPPNTNVINEVKQYFNFG